MGIAALEDKVVQHAVGRVLNQIWEEDFLGFSYVRNGPATGDSGEHRIADQRIVRLIRKWLKAGVLEEGRWFETEEGTPQGAVISPMLANLYLHHVRDLWVEVWRKKIARGDVIVVRYADDAVLGFQYGEDAARFPGQLRERLGKFGLEHPEKTRLIEFGRYATERRAKRGEGKPETFNFLGFTHICTTIHRFLRAPR